jgi:hypothetical protein
MALMGHRRKEGLGEFRTRASDGTEPCLVLGFGNVGERAIRDGIAAVGDLLS